VRFGGDEFVFVAVGVTGVGAARAVADRLHASLSRPYILAG
jgi:GGDEF domain-containing protein